MIDMNFHGINAVDMHCLFDFPSKDGKYREGVQVVHQGGYRRKELTLIMVDSEKDSAYKLNVEDMSKSKSFLALLSDEDRDLILSLSVLSENELVIRRAEEAAHALNDFMNQNWDQAIYDHAIAGDDWKPEKYQNYFTVWGEVKRNEKQTEFELERFPSPHQALNFMNNHQKLFDNSLYIAYGMSFVD